MRSYDFESIDVGILIENFIKEGNSEARANINENIEHDAGYVQAFIDEVDSYTINQSQLLVGGQLLSSSS